MKKALKLTIGILVALSTFAFAQDKDYVYTCKKGYFDNKKTGEQGILHKESTSLFKFVFLKNNSVFLSSDNKLFKLKYDEEMSGKDDDGIAYKCYNQPNENIYCFFEDDRVKVVLTNGYFIEMGDCSKIYEK